ncbi:MAG: hypothetical protein ACJ0BW_01425 [Pontiellaceae bacterium]
MKKQIICMKWGTLYNAEYVNKLYNMVLRNSTTDIRFVCLTDNTNDINKNIETYDCPTINLPSPQKNWGWRKLSLFNSSNKLFNLTGDWLFLDLDIVITANIDDFFTYKPELSFIVMKNWTQPKKEIGNTSIYRFKIGSNTHLIDKINNNYELMFKKYSNSQTYISDNISTLNFWPNNWCRLFKVDCIPRWPMNYFCVPKIPLKCKIIAFPGSPNPHDAVNGIWPEKRKWKRIYKKIRPTKWISEFWR